MKKKVILGLVGATASGKTALSLALAKALQGEILCMDSMQVYQRMDIGTAKPTKEEQAAAKHHLLDVVSPVQPFSVTEYAALARPLMDAVETPILVGGTGLYLKALSLPLDFGFVKGDDLVRAKYQSFLDANGKEALHRLLGERDPATAGRLHPNDTRRVIRALEVYEMTGIPFSEQVMPREADSPYRFCLFAIDMPRDILYRRINGRVDGMMKEGLLDEVSALLKSGVPAASQAMQGLGYKELIPYLEGKASLDSAVELIKQRTRNYAKRQLTWFRADRRIMWIVSTEDAGTQISRVIRTWEDYQNEQE